MAFSRKISGRSASRKNPVLQSSLEYDQYLKAKMHPTSDRGSPSRGSERERPPQERRRAPMDRPSPPPSYMRGTKSTSRGGDSAEEKGDSFDIPMQHSWKRYVPPAQSADPAQPLVDAATLGTFDFSKVPETPQDVASLMAAARASIEMSRQRSAVIDGMLAQESPRVSMTSPGRSGDRWGSSSGRNALAHASSENRDRDLLRSSIDSNTSQESADSTSWQNKSKIRTYQLKKGFQQLAQASDSSRRQRASDDRRQQQLALTHDNALKRRFLQNWKLSAREASVQSQLAHTRMRATFRKWAHSRDAVADDALRRGEGLLKAKQQDQQREIFGQLLRGVRSRRVEEQEQIRLGALQVGAERFRQKALLRTSFRGLLAETKKTAVDRALDEESSNRRARIAALMSTLTVAEKEEEGSTSAPTRAESKATPDRASSSRTSARRETKHMGIVQSPRSQDQNRGNAGGIHSNRDSNKGSNGSRRAGGSLVGINQHELALPLPLGAEAKCSSSSSRMTSRTDRGDKGTVPSSRTGGRVSRTGSAGSSSSSRGVDTKGERPGGRVKAVGVDRAEPKGGERERERAVAGAKQGASREMRGRDTLASRRPESRESKQEWEPQERHRGAPPTYTESVGVGAGVGEEGNNLEEREEGVTSTSRRVPHYLSTTTASTNSRSTARAKIAAVADKVAQSSSVSTARAKADGAKEAMTREQLDERAEQRRSRLSHIQHQSQQRVSLTQQEQQRVERLKLEEEDAEFAMQQEERRRVLQGKKGEESAKAEAEADLRRKWKTAGQHSTVSLLTRAGFGPWQRLMTQSRLDLARALNYREDTLLQQTWIAFYGYCMNLRAERSRREFRQGSMAGAHYRRNLIRHCFGQMKLFRKMLRAKARAVTGHFSRFTVNRRAWGAWRVAVERSRRDYVAKARMVKPKGDRCVKRHAWQRWFQYHTEQLLDREVSNRADLTWAKVQGWMAEGR